ncbi:MAG: hypothetical protein JJ897_12990 [Marinibacterium sp.]|nr:hypothetical protein [Marinibacterium sp.]
MHIREARIARQVEVAIEQILDCHVKGTTAAQTDAYLTSLRLIAGALEREAHAVLQLADEEEQLG